MFIFSPVKCRGAFIIATLLCALVLGSRDANAGVAIEIGPSVLSSEYSEGGFLMLSERFENEYSIGAGIVSKQYCHCNWPAEVDPNMFVMGERNFRGKRANLSLGLAYFQNTNRALGKTFTFTITLGIGTENRRHGVLWRHFSNAGSGAPNLGQDAWVYRYEFGRE